MYPLVSFCLPVPEALSLLYYNLSLEAASYESFSSTVRFRRFRRVSSTREVCIMNTNYLSCGIYSRVAFIQVSSESLHRLFKGDILLRAVFF